MLREQAAAMWFGPKGFASVAYGLLVLESGMPAAGEIFHWWRRPSSCRSGEPVPGRAVATRPRNPVRISGNAAPPTARRTAGGPDRRFRMSDPGPDEARVRGGPVPEAIDHLAPGRDTTFGAGVVNADAALTTDRPAVAGNPLGDPGPPAGDGLLGSRGTVLAGIAAGIAAAATAGLVLTVRRRRRRR